MYRMPLRELDLSPANTDPDTLLIRALPKKEGNALDSSNTAFVYSSRKPLKVFVFALS